MKKLTIIALLLGAMGSIPCWSQLVFEKEQIVHDAGLLEEKAEGVFTFTNTGKETVTIKDVHSSCGCTVPQLQKKIYEPGESGEIVAVFTFGSRVGTQSKRITVTTDEPGDRTYALTMITNIPEWVRMEPRILRWKLDEPFAPQQVKVTISDPSKISLQEDLPKMKSFYVTREQESANEYVFTVAPISPSERATEFMRLEATIKVDGQNRSRSFGIHCLVR